MGEIKGVIFNQILMQFYSAFTRKLGVKSDTTKVNIDSFITSTNWLKLVIIT